MIKLVIFDLDGTLVNSIYDIHDSLNETMREFGYPERTHQDTLSFIGDGVEMLVKRAMPENEGQDAAKVREVTAVFRKTYRKNGTNLTKPYDGIHELLENLSQEGIMVAVASNKYQTASELVVQHYFPHIDFAALEGRRDERPPKPDPKVIYDIITIAGVEKEETVFVGDSDVDMQTAKNAGVTAIGVTWGYRSREVLTTAGADMIADYPESILSFVKKSL